MPARQKRVRFSHVIKCRDTTNTTTSEPLRDTRTAKATEKHLSAKAFFVPTELLRDYIETNKITNKVDSDMANPWHKPSRRRSKKRGTNGATIVLDSGTNITLVTPECPLDNETAIDSEAMDIQSASKNAIVPMSKGGLILGNTGVITPAAKADVNESLLAASDFAVNGYVSILDDSGACITKKEDVRIEYLKPAPITGTFDHDNLWRIPIPGNTHAAVDTPTNKHLSWNTYNAYNQKNSKELVEFLHGCAGYPVLATWIEAIKKGQYASWPGLTPQLVQRYMRKQIPTIMGHMTNIRGGTRSTKPRVDKVNTQLKSPRPHLELQEGHKVNASVIRPEELKGLISTDLAGRFPFQSFKGNNYIFLLYDYDSNAILVTAIRSRQAKDILAGYERCYQRLTDAGITPILQRIDNEISDLLINSIKQKKLDYQIVTSHDHRTNPAERAMRTFKDHFTAILNGTDEGFPAGLWDELLEQTEITLNLLRQSRINPRLSAYAQVFGTFDFNATPLAPLGIRGIMYLNRDNRPTTFADHGKLGWYVGPCLHKYRNYRLWIDDTKGIREHSSVSLMPEKIGIPNTTPADRLSAALEDLKHELQHTPKHTDPLVTEYGTTTNQLIRKLKRLFHPAADKGDHPHMGPSPRVDIQTAKPANLKGARQRFENGTIVYKEYINSDTGKPQVYIGRIDSYKHPFYRIVYEEDGNQEDMTHAVVAKHTYAVNCHRFAGGYSRAVNSIAFQHGTHTSNPTNQALDEAYNHVLQSNAVTHYKTGRQMEYRQPVQMN